MPTYEYACKSCGEHLEVVQSFKDDALTTCPSCGSPLRKVFGTIGIAFKGSGFYRNDSRPAPPSEKTGSESSSASGPDSKSSQAKSETKSDKKSASEGDSKKSSGGSSAAAS
jgi:putative FmdB family regulatory protein